MATATFRIWRGEKGEGKFQDYAAEVSAGMVVLDAVHQIQAEQAGDLAVRWNCKAGKCGSCSAEINGVSKLMCMTRLNTVPLDRPVTVEPMKVFPHIKDLVTDVSWNYEVKKRISKFQPRQPDAPDGTWRIAQEDVERVQEFVESALSAISVRMSATSCATITCTNNSSARDFWCMRPRLKCIRWETRRPRRKSSTLRITPLLPAMCAPAPTLRWSATPTWPPS